MMCYVRAGRCPIAHKQKAASGTSYPYRYVEVRSSFGTRHTTKQHKYTTIIIKKKEKSMDDLTAVGISDFDRALIESARNRRWSKVQRIILRRGGNANARRDDDSSSTRDDDCDWSILEMAIVAGNIDAVRWLIDGDGGGRVDVNATNPHGRTALHTAVQQHKNKNDKDNEQTKEGSNRVHIVKYLLAKRADMRRKTTDSGDTPLHAACAHQSGNGQVIRCLLRSCSTCAAAKIINERNKAGQTPLGLAVRWNTSTTLIEMIECSGANVLAEALDGTTPLHSIIAEGKLDVLQWLVQTNRIDRNYTDKRGRCLMHIAASSGGHINNNSSDAALSLMQWLLNHGFRHQAVTARDTLGRTLLHVAASPAVAAFLVECAGADIHARCNKGATPLHSAVCTPYYSHEIIQWLVTHAGAPVNAQDDHGRTALHVAIGIEDSKAVEWLCRCGGADLTIPDEAGRSPLDLARSDCDETMLVWGQKTSILEMLQHEVSERYDQVLKLAREGAFTCPVRRPVMSVWCSGSS
jgi:ankyrin repeat protein